MVLGWGGDENKISDVGRRARDGDEYWSSYHSPAWRQQ